jgi:small subunit ribosomal protein S6
LTAATNREYELVLMLDPEIPEERREQIASEARTRIESGGQLKHDTSWGMRKLAYEIRQRTEADYRFFRFETGGELLDELSHNLRIADGVLRFRIFKVDPRSPAIVPPAPVASASAPARGSRRSEPPAREEPESRAEETPEEAAEPAAEEAAAAESEQAPAASSEGEGEEQAPASSEDESSEPAEAS